MIFTLAAFIFLFGLIIGSFLNVVIYRYNTGVGLNGRSGCMTCGHQLTWYELFPVLSFLFQKGKCRSCGAKLSWQYPLVELLTGCLFLATFFHYFLYNQTPTTIQLGSFVLMLIAWSLLVVMLVYDIKHKIIPDGIVYAFAFFALLHIFISTPHLVGSVLFSYILAGPLLFLPFFLLWLVSGGRWIGLGDGKLALGIGWMLGIGYGLSAIVLSFWIGAVVSIVLMVIMQLKQKAKSLTMKSEIPFAPFLILGFTIVYFFSIDVIGLHAIFKL